MSKFMKFLLVLFAVLMLALTVTHLAYAYIGETPPPVVLSSEQIVLISLIASVLTTAIKLSREFFTKRAWVYPKMFGEVLVMAVAVVVGYLWFPVSFPALPEFSGDLNSIVVNVAAYLSQWVTLLGQFFGVAYFIYHLILKQVVQDPISTRLLRAKK